MAPARTHTHSPAVPRSRAQRRNDAVVAAYIHGLAHGNGRLRQPRSSRLRSRTRGMEEGYLAARRALAATAGESGRAGGASR